MSNTTLNVAQLLTDPKVLDLLKKNYGEEDVNNLLKQELSNAAIKKQVMEEMTSLDAEHLLYLLLRSSTMLLVSVAEDSEVIDVFADVSEYLADKTNANLTLLDDVDLKNVIKAIAKNDFFLVKNKKSKKEAKLDVKDYLECPID
jgi:hypothetical protein